MGVTSGWVGVGAAAPRSAPRSGSGSGRPMVSSVPIAGGGSVSGALTAGSTDRGGCGDAPTDAGRDEGVGVKRCDAGDAGVGDGPANDAWGRPKDAIGDCGRSCCGALGWDSAGGLGTTASGVQVLPRGICWGLIPGNIPGRYWGSNMAPRGPP